MPTETPDRPLQYLDKAVSAMRDMGLWPEQPADAPIIGLLEQITSLDETRVLLIGRTLAQASAFNEVVRQQVAATRIGQRYGEITSGFDSIREDARKLLDQIDDGEVDLQERVGTVWMKLTRGDIATRSGESDEQH